jgi:hypothetical protein
METNNMNIRAKFEEIWPVPEGIRWESDYMKGNDYYAPDTEHGSSEEHWIEANEWDARLDTFTRCQEIMLASIPERIEMQPYQTVDRGSTNYKAGFNACVKQIMESLK